MRQDQANTMRNRKDDAPPGGFWRRLLRDRRGNVMAIMCAALIPLLGIIGSGVDMARAYTAQARMQQACDAAALAGRRMMTADAITDTVTDETRKFFNFNFPQRMYDTATFTPVITRPRAGTVAVRAATTMPTMLMKIFGFETLPVTASCDASQEFMNIDVVMVLDTTGSMNESMSDGNKKIQALRDAVMAFYDQMLPVQNNLKANGYRIRYSIVPYSSTVNVGKLVNAVNSSYIRKTAPYVRIYNYTRNGDDYDLYWYTATIAHETDPDWMAKWPGCIEERGTVATATATPTDAELATMYDLNIDLIPGPDDATKWPMADGQLGAACPSEAVRLREWTRDDLLAYVNKLKPEGSTYLDIGMVWGGRFVSDAGVFGDSPVTYNGMRVNKFVIFLTDGEMEPLPAAYSAWGAELMQRRVTGGTQGNPVVKAGAASDALDPSDTDRHNARFDLLCRAVRGKSSVWTIKVSDKVMDSHLRDCAHPNQSATVSNKQTLLNQFSLIAQQITELRLAL